MDSERVILHSDMNSFYASVEMMLDPELKGKPVAVCGSTEERHGIVLAKSDLAKKAGVKTGMVNWEARQLCPGLIVVPPQYDQYLKYSKLARQIYHRYTDLVEPYGMDECWLDVTGSSICGTGMEIAEAIRQTTKDELGLTVSIGVSFNKIFAKLGSDMKKPDAITEIRQDNFKEKIWPLDAAELLYVGRSTENKLAQYGIRTIGDVAKTSPETLQHMLGINGIKLWRYANGTDTSRVMHKDFVSPVKSIGHGITCTADLQTPEEVFRVMLELSQDVGHRLRVHELMACGVQVSVRANDLVHNTSVSSHSGRSSPMRSQGQAFICLWNDIGGASQFEPSLSVVLIWYHRKKQSSSPCSWIIRSEIAASVWRTLLRTFEKGSANEPFPTPCLWMT